jgi:hypothetical protein
MRSPEKTGEAPTNLASTIADVSQTKRDGHLRVVLSDRSTTVAGPRLPLSVEASAAAAEDDVADGAVCSH